jgi:deoxycytidine triphosphate deaminase
MKVAEENSRMKVLADHEIEAAIARGELILDAEPTNCVGACYELRMGNVYYDLTEGEKRWEVPPEGDVLIKPGHRVVLLTYERLALSGSVFARIVSKGSLFSIGLSAVATYADPGFNGRIGIVTQNLSEKYIVIPALERIAKVDFTILETPAVRLYKGQHGYDTEIWPIKHRLQKTREQLADDPRLGGTPAPAESQAAGGTGESLASLVRRQIDADRAHGFPIDLPDDESRRNQLFKDLVGLMGEMGEFANLVKKVELAATQPGYEGPSLTAAHAELQMELADAQIYMLRLAHLLRVELADAVAKKMRINDERYAHLRPR